MALNRSVNRYKTYLSLKNQNVSILCQKSSEDKVVESYVFELKVKSFVPIQFDRVISSSNPDVKTPTRYLILFTQSSKGS